MSTPEEISILAAEAVEACTELELVAGIVADDPNATAGDIDQAVILMRMVRAGFDVSEFCPPDLLERIKTCLSGD
jgi:hypothetical protein